MTAEHQLLQQANQTLSKCARKIYAPGESAVLIPSLILVQAIFDASPSGVNQSVFKEIEGDAPFMLRSISAASSDLTGLSIQIRLPNGRFLISALQDLLQSAGIGSYRYLFRREVECPPGSQIQVTLQDTNPSAVQSLAMTFEGGYKYRLKASCNGNSFPVGARYKPTPNQNIIAPMWMQGSGPAPLGGCREEEFIYASNEGVPFPVSLAAPYGTLAIQIDRESDFRIRRMFFGVSVDSTVTTPGRFLIRMRSGSGCEATNDYIDANLYLGGSQFAKNWHIAAGDQVFFDLSLVDAVGTGNMYLVVYPEGTKVKRAA